jgi:DNA-binding transcriptional LysR family regulator
MILSPFQYIEAVARFGSIRVAADHLHVAPSAISRHIKNIEEEFGVQMFERHARGVKLTLPGQIFVDHIKKIFLDRERVRSEINDIKGIRRGHIRIHTIDGVAAGPLSVAISTFRERFPGITFRLFSAGTATVIDAVKNDEADIGVAFQAARDPEIAIVHRIPDPLHAIVSSKHALAKAKQITLQEFLSFPLALPESNFGVRMLVDEACRRKALHLQPVIETNSIDSLRGFARSGAGITALPYNSIKRELPMGLVKSVPFKETSLSRATMIIGVRLGRTLPAAVTEFTNHLYRTLIE